MGAGNSLHRNFWERLAGPAGSVALHAALVFILLFFVKSAEREPPDPGVEVRIVEPEEMVLDDLELDEFVPEELPEIVETVDIPAVDIEMPPPETDFAFNAPAMDAVMELALATDISSPLVMEGLRSGQYANRIGAGRASAMGAAGKWGEAAEAAVSRALEWLRLNQRDDGSWSGTPHPAYRVAFASLGTLTFLAHGETVQSERYGDTVRRALQFLLAKQNGRGEFCTMDGAGVYAQAMAVYAVSEAYGMMGIPDLKPAMEKGVQVVIDGQHDGGGFDYGFAGSVFYREKHPSGGPGSESARRDTSVGAWCCQAMKAAQIAGAANPGLDEAMERAVGDLKRAFVPATGTFAYDGEVGCRGVGGSPNTTGMATLAMQLLGHGGDHEARRGVAFLEDFKCRWQSQSGYALYGWYYITQAKFHEGGRAWARWNAEFAPQFVRAQIRNDNPAENGSWTSPGGEMTEAGDCDRAYSTTLAALTLQVYYRHLQTYRPVEKRVPVDQKSGDDAKIAVF